MHVSASTAFSVNSLCIVVKRIFALTIHFMRIFDLASLIFQVMYNFDLITQIGIHLSLHRYDHSVADAYAFIKI